MKLYAWQPKGHGELSWFVLADSEEIAREKVWLEINRRSSLDLLSYAASREIAEFQTSRPLGLAAAVDLQED